MRIVTPKPSADGVKYAMKSIGKGLIRRENLCDSIQSELEILNKCNHPNIVKFISSFSDEQNVYHVFELAPHGSLLQLLDEGVRFSVEQARIVAGQILLAIAHMHQKRILHCALTPAHILFGDEWRVKIIHFREAKNVAGNAQCAIEHCPAPGSTPEAYFLPPEAFADKPLMPSGDLWTFGCLIFAMLKGHSPFYKAKWDDTFAAIREARFEVSELPDDAVDLLRKLLVFEAEKRLGHSDWAKNYAAIRNHSFFAGTDWEALPDHPGPEMREPASLTLRQAPSNGRLSLLLPTRRDSRGTKSQIPEVRPRPDVVIREPVKSTPDRPPSSPVGKPLASSIVPGFLRNSEVSLLEGKIIKRRRKLSIKERYLVLTDEPRLFYLDIKFRQPKGDIPLTKETKASLTKKPKRWKIEVPQRTYDLESEDKMQAAQWVEEINAIVTQKIIR
jgi:serine/threonine protein kinase